MSPEVRTAGRSRAIGAARAGREPVHQAVQDDLLQPLVEGKGEHGLDEASLVVRQHDSVREVGLVVPVGRPARVAVLPVESVVVIQVDQR